MAGSQAGSRRVHQLRAVGPAPCAPTLTASGARLWRPPRPSSSYKRGGGTSQVGWTRAAPRVECRLEAQISRSRLGTVSCRSGTYLQTSPQTSMPGPYLMMRHSHTTPADAGAADVPSSVTAAASAASAISARFGRRVARMLHGLLLLCVGCPVITSTQSDLQPDHTNPPHRASAFVWLRASWRGRPDSPRTTKRSAAVPSGRSRIAREGEATAFVSFSMQRSTFPGSAVPSFLAGAVTA